jgi:hypothetical protein
MASLLPHFLALRCAPHPPLWCELPMLTSFRSGRAGQQTVEWRCGVSFFYRWPTHTLIHPCPPCFPASPHVRGGHLGCVSAEQETRKLGRGGGWEGGDIACLILFTEHNSYSLLSERIEEPLT